MWQISNFTKCTKNFNSAFKNLPQASANNLEMHKLFIKAAPQNTLPPTPTPTPWAFVDICFTFMLFILLEWSFAWRWKWKRPGRVSAWQPWILTATGLRQWTDNTSLPATGKQALRRSPLTPPSRPLALIYAGSCFTVSKTIAVLLSTRQSYLGLPACGQNTTHAAENAF